MLAQNDNQLISIGPCKFLGDLSFNYALQASQIAMEHGQTIKIPSVLPEKKQCFDMECRKEIRHYFGCLRKYISLVLLERKHSWLNIALRLFGSKKKVQEDCNEASKKGKLQKQKIINSEIICLINKPLKLHSFLILILSSRTLKHKNQEIYFDVELISSQAKIIYKKINLKNWQEIQSEVQKVKNYQFGVLMLVEDKDRLTFLLQTNAQSRSLIKLFYDIQSVNIDQMLGTIKQSECENIYEIIGQYQFVKKSLINLIQVNASINLSVNELLALTIAFNIVAIMQVSYEKSFRSQIEPFQSMVIKHFQLEYEKQQDKYAKNMAMDYHFPDNLQNAQNCWKCKLKRGYICCPACSRKQSKTISLCLSCYQSHHGEVRKQIESSKKAYELTLKNWEDLNSEVELMMW